MGGTMRKTPLHALHLALGARMAPFAGYEMPIQYPLGVLKEHLYTRASALFRDLALARADGSLRNLLTRLSRVDVLIVDDWAMAPMQEAERRDFWEIAEERYQSRSTILTSQVPLAQWHEQIGDATIADGILDRLVHNAHRIELRGESMRKTKGKKPETKEET